MQAIELAKMPGCEARVGTFLPCGTVKFAHPDQPQARIQTTGWIRCLSSSATMCPKQTLSLALENKWCHRISIPTI